MLIFLYLLQTTVGCRIAIAGIKPDMVIVLVVMSAYRYGRVYGMFMGFFAGLLIDLVEGDYIGMYALFYLIVGYYAGFSNQLFDRDYSTMPVLVIGASSLAINLIEYVAGFLLRNRLDFPYYFGRIILPSLLYTVVISIFLYRFVNLVYRKIDNLNLALERKKKEKKEEEIV
jgi:rod shape-determining protein MreD